jgi:maltose/moltooligosaccharide transporter
MLVQGVTLSFAYHRWLHGDPGQVVALAGVLLLGAALATLFVNVPDSVPASVTESAGEEAH